MERRGGSVSIQDILNRYRTHLRPPQKTVVEEVVRVYTVLGLPIEYAKLRYTKTTRTISILVNGPQKTEMLLKKGEALNALRLALGERDCPLDIV